MAVTEQRTGKYTITLNREERKKLYRNALQQLNSPADLLFWLIWHWLQNNCVVSFPPQNSQPNKTLIEDPK